MKNIIYENDAIIGTKENLWKSFKEEIKRQLDDNTIDFEELKNNFSDIMEVMGKIQDNQDIYNNTLLIIKESPMGSLYYKILEEVE